MRAGAKFVYENFVDEVFQKHEVDIDHSLAVCKAQVLRASCYLRALLPAIAPRVHLPAARRHSLKTLGSNFESRIADQLTRLVVSGSRVQVKHRASGAAGVVASYLATTIAMALSKVRVAHRSLRGVPAINKHTPHTAIAKHTVHTQARTRTCARAHTHTHTCE